MTREEAINKLNRALDNNTIEDVQGAYDYIIALKMAIKALEQEPCEDAISRQAAIRWVKTECNPYGKPTLDFESGKKVIEHLERMSSVTPQPKIGHCKDCKWWKDSDGLYRRGGHAESQCPISRREVFEGSGYCYMFEPQERR